MQKESHAQALASYSPVMRALLTLALLTSILSYSPVALTQETNTLLPQLTDEPFGSITDGVSLPKLHAAIGRNTIVRQSTLAEMPRIIALENNSSIASQEDLVLVAGKLDTGISEYSIYRLGETHTRLVEKQRSGPTEKYAHFVIENSRAQIQELEFIGSATLPAKPSASTTAESPRIAANERRNNAPRQWLRVTTSVGAVRKNDVIVPAGTLGELSLASVINAEGLNSHGQRLVASSSPCRIDGQVLSFFSGRKWGARQTIMIIDRGQIDGLNLGMRVAIVAPNQADKDLGDAIIYALTPYFSLALILPASQPIERGSRIKGTAAAVQ